jgi:hypothetical protein
LIVPNEDFLRAAEALRLHNFTALEMTADSPHHLDSLEHYAAQYTFPLEITDQLGTDVTVALFPASLLGWKIIYIPVPDAQRRGSFTTTINIQKIPLPEPDIEKSFIQLSRSSSKSDVNDGRSVSDDDTASTISNTVQTDSDDEYVVIRPYAQVRTTPVERRESVAMERGNGPKSPGESDCDIADMKPEPGTGAIEMIPGQKMLEKSEGQLIMINKGLYVPRTEGLKESLRNALEFLSRDNLRESKFAKVLEGWNNLLGAGMR